MLFKAGVVSALLAFTSLTGFEARPTLVLPNVLQEAAEGSLGDISPDLGVEGEETEGPIEVNTLTDFQPTDSAEESVLDAEESRVKPSLRFLFPLGLRIPFFPRIPLFPRIPSFRPPLRVPGFSPRPIPLPLPVPRPLRLPGPRPLPLPFSLFGLRPRPIPRPVFHPRQGLLLPPLLAALLGPAIVYQQAENPSKDDNSTNFDLPNLPDIPDLSGMLGVTENPSQDNVITNVESSTPSSRCLYCLPYSFSTGACVPIPLLLLKIRSLLILILLLHLKLLLQLPLPLLALNNDVEDALSGCPINYDNKFAIFIVEGFPPQNNEKLLHLFPESFSFIILLSHFAAMSTL
ncbi:unnamed protein product [Dibothriocephalus latus]|uniref:Uncharacterized protein n=1 Tax=Dibothriocephalus latus TaxID=60516 RepID=A0A3P7M2K7_DIBLA|nr:unnamed protein product [Dibothriocephalus latus]